MTERSEDALKACDMDAALGALRYVLNFADSNTRVSSVMKTFTLPDRMTTREKLEWLYRNTRSEASAPVIDEGLIKRLFGEFGVFRMARTGWLGSNNTAKVQEVIETETQLRAALEAGCAGLVAENARLREALEGCDAYFEALEHCGNEKHPEMRKMIRTAFRGDRERGEG
jgi:hypothetical protein